MSSVVIIGGGVVGLSSAYYLNKAGHQVTVIDKSDGESGASFVNAGYVSPSHLIPLAAPGVMKQGLKWMFNASSPLYMKPRINYDFIKWALAFNRSCSNSNVDTAIPAILDLTLLSQDLYRSIREEEALNFHFEDKGLLVLCSTSEMFEKETKIVESAKKEGLEVSVLDASEIKRLQPSVSDSVIGGAYYKCDSHSTPHEFMKEIRELLKVKGVSFYNEEVVFIEHQEKKAMRVHTNNSVFDTENLLVASGSWSAKLLKPLGVNLLLQAGKGYRLNLKSRPQISLPAILAESKVAVTPMNGFVRVAGTMEFSGINHDINKKRVQAIANGFMKYYSNEFVDEDELNMVACGLRPVSPDGLPFIGRVKPYDNLFVAAGHAMMGWSMATGTGKIIADLIEGKDPEIKMGAFNPLRRF